LAPITMATLSSAASPFCRPEEDPFLLLESCGKAIEAILRGHAGRPLRRTWILRPFRPSACVVFGIRYIELMGARACMYVGAREEHGL